MHGGEPPGFHIDSTEDGGQVPNDIGLGDRGAGAKGGAAEPAVTPGGAGEPAGAAEVTTAVLVERVQLLAPSDAARVRHVLKQLITVAGQVRGSTRPALPTWSQEESPAKVAKCRQLGRWPTGDSVPESQDVGATP